MELLENEEILMTGDYKQITLTTHRIRQEAKSWGTTNLTSILLEHITSCEYSRKSNPIQAIIGVAAILLALGLGSEIGNNSQYLTGILLLFGLIQLFLFFRNYKQRLYISSPSAKISLDTSGMKNENIIKFINKLEEAISNRKSKK